MTNNFSLSFQQVLLASELKILLHFNILAINSSLLLNSMQLNSIILVCVGKLVVILGVRE